MKQRFPYKMFYRRTRRGLIATVASISANLAQRLGREPTDEEVAQALAIRVDHVRRARSEAGAQHATR